jgi:hypothetical protein
MENCRLNENSSPHGLIISPDRTNDKICIFGFSRGAYTARALAGMIHKVSGIDKSCSDFALTFPRSACSQQGIANRSPSLIECTLARTKMDGSKASSSKKPFRWISEWSFLASGTCLVLCYPRHLTNQDAPCRDTVCSVGFIPRQLPFTASNTTVRFFRHALALDERRATFLVNPWHRRSRDDYHDDQDERPKSDVREVWFAGCHAGSFCPHLFTAASP